MHSPYLELGVVCRTWETVVPPPPNSKGTCILKALLLTAILKLTMNEQHNLWQFSYLKFPNIPSLFKGYTRTPTRVQVFPNYNKGDHNSPKRGPHKANAKDTVCRGSDDRQTGSPRGGGNVLEWGSRCIKFREASLHYFLLIQPLFYFIYLTHI